ncbi:MAG TPA: tetratricopeptide repeat protein [Burkholderiales bacterium]
MSLLLEALKKAEKAKEEAQRRARGDTPGSATPLRLEESAPATAEQPHHVTTRDELPKISQPLEILSEDIRPGPERGGQSSPPPAQAAKSQKPPPARESTAAPAGERATAKKVFEAKFKEPNPRLPFYITMGVLGVFALGTVGYFWYQLRPPPALVNAAPRPASEVPAAAAQNPAAPAVPGPSATAPGAIPGLPQQSSGAIASSAQQPAPAAPEPERAPAPAAQSPRPRPAPAQPEIRREERATEVTVTRAAPAQVSPRVSAGYAAYGAGDLNTAREEYQQVLRDEPANRDALLGLAAVELRSGRPEAAEAAYLRVLQSDPRDPHAEAALISLRGARLDPVAVESRIKSLLATDPGAHELHFALGNQFAQQGRWAEAQQQYFKAFSAEPENADFAYNLAVSLDHIGQPKLALDYYRRALALAPKAGAAFSLDAARTRAAQLAR